MTAIREHVDVQPGTHTSTPPVQLQYLAAKLTLTVTDADGVAQVLPVLDSEPISHLVEGLEAVGGSANVFVHTSAGVVALSVVEYKPNEEE